MDSRKYHSLKLHTQLKMCPKIFPISQCERHCRLGLRSVLILHMIRMHGHASSAHDVRVVLVCFPAAQSCSLDLRGGLFYKPVCRSDPPPVLTQTMQTIACAEGLAIDCPGGGINVG